MADYRVTSDQKEVSFYEIFYHKRELLSRYVNGLKLLIILKGVNEMLPSKVQTIESRQIAEMMGREHRDLLKDIRKYLGYLAEGKIPLGDFFLKSQYLDKNNQERPCYLITKKGCEFIANKLTSKKGAVFTAVYIDKFHEMEQSLLQQKQFGGFYIPSDYPSALQLAANFAKENERQKQVIEQQEEQLKLQKPAVEFTEQIETSEDTISIGMLSKILSKKGICIGRNELMEQMREKGYLIKQKGIDYNSPRGSMIKNGYMEVKVFSGYDKKTGKNFYNNTPLITGKGLSYFVRKFSKEIKNSLLSKEVQI